MKRFLRDTRGYALILTLVFLPAFLALTLLMIDIGRGNNAQTDHQAAADALALAAARELDGAADSITRAQAAMENVTNTVAYLARSGEDTLITLDYPPESGVSINVIFLTDIPASDDLPIDQTWVNANGTTDGRDARYVYVRTQARDLDGFFFNPLNFVRPSTPVGAQAVATYRASACNVTPLFICNPFEDTTVGGDLPGNYAAGFFHAKLIRLVPKKGNLAAAPGNFGFLSATDADGRIVNGVNELGKLIAGERNAVCYERGALVDTQTGSPETLSDAFNVRFDIYAGGYKPNSGPFYPPAQNVRKGFVAETAKGSDCEGPAENDLWARPFGEGAMIDPGGLVAGAAIEARPWSSPLPLEINRFDEYWKTNHADWKGKTPISVTVAKDEIASTSPFKPVLGTNYTPSRYELYRYEIDNQDRGLLANLSQGNNANVTLSDPDTQENGLPDCGESLTTKEPIDTGEDDRRLLFAAVIDCRRELSGGKTRGVNVNSFASIFLANPVGPSGSIDVEIVDITGAGGNGTLETFLREEAFLVR